MAFERHLVAIVLALLAVGSCIGSSTAQESKGTAPAKKGKTASFPPAPSYTLTPGYTIKASEVAVPAGVKLGQYRRVIRPFTNWTLVCDENLDRKRKICNISQSILGPSGDTVFSWSLAASEDGKPFFILRAPMSIGPQASIALDPGDGGKTISVAVSGCNETVCIAYLPVSDRLRQAAAKGGTVDISYVAKDRPTSAPFRAPLDGLAAALSVI